MGEGYPLKHWFATIIAGALILSLYWFVFDLNQLLDVPEIFFFSVIFGFIISMPALLIYFFFFNLMRKKIDDIFILKAVLNLFVIAEIVITLLLIDGTVDLELTLIYSSAVILTSFFLKISRKEEKISG